MIISTSVPKTGKKKRVYRKKRFTGKRSNTTLTIHRTVYSPVNQIVAGADSGFAYYFQMSQVPNFSEISNMFKQIKLNKVSLRWVPGYTQVDVTNTQRHTYIYTAINPNNVNSGTPTAGSIREQDNFRLHTALKPWSVSLKPVLKAQIGQAGINTYYADKPCAKQWLSPSQADVQYYGFDFLVADSGNLTGTLLGSMEITYSIECRGSR